MERLTIERNTKQQWHLTLALLGLFAWSTVFLWDGTRTSTGIQAVTEWVLIAIIVVSGLRLLLGLFMERSVVLVATHPPTLVIDTRWFGKYSTSKSKTIAKAAWVRVNYADDAGLAIEVGTYSHHTTSLCFIPYSESNVSVAKELCTEVAQFLKLEDRGYRAVF